VARKSRRGSFLSDAVTITANDQPATVDDLSTGSRIEVTVKMGSSEAVAIKILDRVAKPRV
jgi:hypothetical protein